MKCRLFDSALFWKLVLGLYFIALGYLCFSSGDSFPHKPSFLDFEGSDKLVHFLMFAPFPWIACLAGGYGFRRPSGKVLAIILLSGLTFGGITEIIQGMLPERSRDILDFTADACAILLNCLLLVSLPKAPSES